jgi:methyl-accepting chemotaxis protein
MADNGERWDRIEHDLKHLAASVVRHDSQIEKLTEHHQQLEGAFARLIGIQSQFVEEVARRFRETDERMRQTAEQLRETDERMRQTAEQLRETDERLRHTDDRVNALVDTVDSIVRRLPPPAPA